MWLSRGEDEDDVRRGFFERFQQRIEGGSRQHVHFVDDVDLARAVGRHVLGALANLAYGFNAVIGSAVDLDDVNARTGRDFAAACALVTALEPFDIFAVRVGRSGNRVFTTD